MSAVGRWLRRRLVLLVGLACLLAGAAAGFLTRFEGPVPSLGGPNALLYDLALGAAARLDGAGPAAAVAFVAVDDRSLAAEPLARVPRALFQPFWAELIDGLLAAGARKIAFDIVFAYAGDDFAVGPFRIPDYDRALVDALARSRGRVVLGRYPSVPPAPSFARAAGAGNVAVLDIRPESDGRVRSVASLLRLPEGRAAFGFAALAAGLRQDEILSTERLFVAPARMLTDVPTYRLGPLLGCLKSPAGAEEIARVVRGRVVVVGTALPGEDIHRGPTRFVPTSPPPAPAGPCGPERAMGPASEGEPAPGALLHAAAIEGALGPRPVRAAPDALLAALGAALAGAFCALVLTAKAPLANVGRSKLAARRRLHAIAGVAAVAVLGPVAVGTAMAVGAFVLARVWLPLGAPILLASGLAGAILTVRALRHRREFDRLFQAASRYLPLGWLSDPARSGDTQSGEEREVSLVLADLIGFTDFVTDPYRSASVVVRDINRHFTIMQDAVDRFGGFTDKFIGDAVLAFWNGLHDDPDHAAQALAAALAMVADLEEAARRPSPDGAPTRGMRARVVVATGRVYVGDLGADQRRNFTIVGPVVNEAFRLEKAPDLYGLPVLAAGGTVEALLGAGPDPSSPLFGRAFVRVDDLPLKGFSELRPIFAVVSTADPGLDAFLRGRAALDGGRVAEAVAALRSVRDGSLAVAAARLLTQIGPPPPEQAGGSAAAGDRAPAPQP